MTDINFGNSANFNWFQTKKLRFQLLASDPASAAEAWAYVNSVTHKLRIFNGTTWDEYSAGGSGTVSAISIATANGFAGTSDGNAAMPALTFTTTVTGLVKGNGTALSAAVAGTDYAAATSGSAALKGNGAGGFGTATINDLGSQTADYSANSHKFTNVTDPTADQDAATKKYVDSVAQGLDFKQSVRAAVTTNVTLATALENGDSAGGVTLATNDRIALFGQSSASENGLWTVNASGSPTRATDADNNGDISKGAIVFVEEGTNAGQLWVATATGATPWVPGTSTSTWTQFAGAADILGGAGLVKTGNSLAVGAGTGIIVNADDVALDTAVAVRKYNADIGDGSTTDIVVTHGLGTKSITWSVREKATDDMWLVGVNATTTNTATFSFLTAPTTNQFNVTVHG